MRPEALLVKLLLKFQPPLNFICIFVITPHWQNYEYGTIIVDYNDYPVLIFEIIISRQRMYWNAGFN